MSTRLRFEYETVQQAVSQIQTIRGGLEDNLGRSNGFFGDLLSSWIGLAAGAFGSWWESIATRRANELNNELDQMGIKLNRIAQTIQQMDQELAARFRQPQA